MRISRNHDKWSRTAKTTLLPATISFFLLLLSFSCALDAVSYGRFLNKIASPEYLSNPFSVSDHFQIFSRRAFVDETEALFLMSSRAASEPQECWSLRCLEQNRTQNCPPVISKRMVQRQPGPSCPEYFRWIHEDLRPWKEAGITREMVEDAWRVAHGPVRVVILEGKVYVQKQRQALPNRETYTMWGILQLLRLYPGALPDLEMVFDHTDQPYVLSTNFGLNKNAVPPPLFKYCSSNSSFDIVFPDASFWNWPKSNMRPWVRVLRDIRERNKRIKWKDRLPYAYWRGNPKSVPARTDLLKCNVSRKNDWSTRIYIQDWEREIRQGFPKSNIVDQCTHRYKIYVQGYTWSISDKYVLACDSMTLYINSQFYDFFGRGLVPLKHYWPIRDDQKCPSLKFAVDWGNNHLEKAKEIGEASSKFIQENLNMESVYDYMYHLFNEYAKLLTFKPEIPPNAMELCSENLLCPIKESWKKWMVESLVTKPSSRMPCTLPPLFTPRSCNYFLRQKLMLLDKWKCGKMSTGKVLTTSNIDEL